MSRPVPTSSLSYATPARLRDFEQPQYVKSATPNLATSTRHQIRELGPHTPLDTARRECLPNNRQAINTRSRDPRDSDHSPRVGTPRVSLASTGSRVIPTLAAPSVRHEISTKTLSLFYPSTILILPNTLYAARLTRHRRTLLDILPLSSS